MKTVKFISADINQKQFAAEVRKNVLAYFKDNKISTKGDAGLYFRTFLMIACYVVPFILIFSLTIPNWLAFVFCILMGVGIAGTGMCTMHDAVHGAYSNKKWVNNLMGGTLYLLGSNVFNWKIQHNVLHHTYTNINGLDQDIESKGPIRLSDNAPLKKFHKYQFIHAFLFYGLMTLAKLTKDFTQLATYNKAGITKNYKFNPTLEYIKMVVFKLAYISVIIGLPILYTQFTWWQVILGFFIMHWTAGAILSTVFQMAHVVEGAEQPLPDKNGVVNCDWTVHELNTTSDFAPKNKLLNWYVGGLNFQIEHHIFPNICHIHYPKIAPIVEATAKKYGYQYNLKPSLWDAFKSHVIRLKELGQPIPAIAN